jgi:hypothetical protein
LTAEIFSSDWYRNPGRFITGFASRRVTRVLDEIIARRGLPQAICNNGPEFTSRHSGMSA